MDGKGLIQMTVKRVGELLQILVRVSHPRMEAILLYKEQDGIMMPGNWIGTGLTPISAN